MVVSKTSVHIQIKIKMPYPSQGPPESSKASNEDLKYMDLFEPSKPTKRAKIQQMSVSQTSDLIQIKIKIPNPKKETPASSKAQNQDLKDMVGLCTFQTKMVTLNLEYGCIKGQ